MRLKAPMWYLYIVRCSDNSLYTGITTDVTRRVKTHNAKRGAFYTKNKLPVELVHQEALPNEGAARKKERQVKRLDREKKLLFASGIYELVPISP